MASTAAARNALFPADTRRSRAHVDRPTTFNWTGVDRRGGKRKGEIAGKTAVLVKAELRRLGINPTSVTTQRKALFGARGRRIKTGDIAAFSRQIAVMTAAGVPMVQGLDIIAGGQTNPRMQTLLTAIKNDIETGSSLAQSLRKHPKQFDELYCSLIKVGESAGVLDIVLDTAASYKESIETLKGKIKKAMFYPSMVFLVAMIVSAILLVFVVPQFESVFKNFGAQLPAFTQTIVDLSRFVTAKWWWLSIGCTTILCSVMLLHRRSNTFALFCARSSLRLPVVGAILRNAAVARFARTLGVTVKAGVPLVDALASVSGVTGNRIYNDAILRIRHDVAIGYPLHFALRQANLFPNMVVQMVGIGEEAGALDTMLFKVAAFFEQEVNNSVDALSSLLEPIIMLIIGTLVGGMVIGMYLPIFKLANVIG